ncbi:MAG TPA: hypothetical protein VFP72_04190 [Kineosporiaceae bacterium]|nr:hypothetical protein [Kineosporiaceae bacterium]
MGSEPGSKLGPEWSTGSEPGSGRYSESLPGSGWHTPQESWSDSGSESGYESALSSFSDMSDGESVVEEEWGVRLQEAPEVRPGVLTAERAAAFWESPAPEAFSDVLRPGLTGRVPVPEVLDAGSWGLGQMLGIRQDTVTADEVVAPASRPVLADPIDLHRVVDGTLATVGMSGTVADHVLAEVKRLLPLWSSADVLNTLDAHRLWRGLEISVPGPEGPMAVTVKLSPREQETVLSSSAVEIPDDTDTGVSYEAYLDSYSRNDITRGSGVTHSATGTVSGGVDLLAGTPWTAGLTARLFGGGGVSQDTSTRTYTTRTSIPTARGLGRWASFDLPAELAVTVRREQMGEGGTTGSPDAVSDPETGAVTAVDREVAHAEVPVRVKVRLPLELTRDPGQQTAPVRVPVTDAAARSDLTSSVLMAAESAATGKLYTQLRQAMAEELGADTVEHPLAEARWALENLVHEPTLMRHLPDLGIGLNSTRFPLAAYEGGELVPVGDAPVFRPERASQLGEDHGLVKGTPFGRLRITAEVGAVEVLDLLPDDLIGSVTKKHQGMIEQSNLSASSNAGGGFKGGVGYADGVTTTFGADLSGTMGASNSGGSALSSRVYPKNKVLPDGPMRRVRLDLKWSVDLLRTDQQGLGLGESGASARWPVTENGQVTVRLPESDLPRLLQRVGAVPDAVLRDLALPGTGSVPAEGVAAQKVPAEDVAQTGPAAVLPATQTSTVKTVAAQTVAEQASAPAPPALVAGTGLGGGLIDEITGASRVVPELDRSARAAVASALRDLGLPAEAVTGAFWLKFRQGLELALSPAALRVSQAGLVQAGVQFPTVVQRLAGGAIGQAFGMTSPMLHLSGRVRAEIQPRTARHVGGHASASLEYGGEQWQVSLATRETGRSVTGTGTISLSLGGLTGSAPVSLTPSVAAGGSIGFTRSVVGISGTWIGDDHVISRSGPTDAFEVDVRFVAELDVRVTPAASTHVAEAAAGGRRLTGRTGPGTIKTQDVVRRPAIAPWPGRLRVQVPSGLTGAGAARLALRTLPAPSLTPALPGGWSSTRYSVQERILELRTGPLFDVVASVLDRAGMGQRGLTGAETVRELHVTLDPDALRILLRQVMSAHGYTVPLRAAGSQRVLGVLRIVPRLMTAPEGPRMLTGPEGVGLKLSDENQLWLHSEAATTLGLPATVRLSLGATVGGTASSGAGVVPLSQGLQANASQSTDRALSFEAFTLDLAGDRRSWAQRPVDIESRGVRWDVRFEPTVAGENWSRRVAETFLVEDGASVIVPRSDHPMRLLAAGPAAVSDSAVPTPPPASPERAAVPDAAALPGPSALFGPAALRRAADPGPQGVADVPSVVTGPQSAVSPVAAGPTQRVVPAGAELVRSGNGVVFGPEAFDDVRAESFGEPLLDKAVELLRGHGRRFLTPRSVVRALEGSLPAELAEGPSARYPELHPVVRDSLTLAALPSLLSQAMSGGLPVPIPPVARGGRISFGYFHLQAAITGEPRLVARLDPGDVRLQRHHLRIETRSATVALSESVTSTVSPSTLSVTAPTPAGAVSLSRTSYRQFTAGRGLTQTFGPSVEVWTSAQVVAPHLVYESEVSLDLSLLRDLTAGQWANVATAPGRAVRWVAGRLGEAAGWHRAGAVADSVESAGPVVTAAGRRTTSTTMRMAVPEPLTLHRPAPAQVSRLTPHAADALRASSALHPSQVALAQAGLVPYSVDPAASRGVTRQVMAAFADAGGPLASALSGGSHLARSLEYALSNNQFGTRMNEFLAGDTYQMTMSSTSGLLTDTGSHLQLGATLIGAKPLTWATVSRTRSPAAIRGSIDGISTNSGWSAVQGWSAGGHVHGAALSGSLLVTDSAREAGRWFGLSEAVDTQSFSRTGPMLLVSADLLVQVGLEVRPESALTVRSGPTRAEVATRHLRADVRADDAAVLMIGWAEARRLGLGHPDGEATEGGWHLPPAPAPGAPGSARPAITGSTTPGITGPDTVTGNGTAGSGAAGNGTAGRGDTAGSGDAAGRTWEERLASAAQQLPAFRHWTTLSGQVTADGRLLLHGEPVEPAQALAAVAAHRPAVANEGLVLVASDGLAVARTLAAQTGRPVVATASTVRLTPERAVTAGEGGPQGVQGWQLVMPDGALVALGPDLAGALTRPEAVAAVNGITPGKAREGAGALLTGAAEGWSGPDTSVAWPWPALDLPALSDAGSDAAADSGSQIGLLPAQGGPRRLPTLGELLGADRWAEPVLIPAPVEAGQALSEDAGTTPGSPIARSPRWVGRLAHRTGDTGQSGAAGATGGTGSFEVVGSPEAVGSPETVGSSTGQGGAPGPHATGDGGGHGGQQPTGAEAGDRSWAGHARRWWNRMSHPQIGVTWGVIKGTAIPPDEDLLRRWRRRALLGMVPVHVPAARVPVQGSAARAQVPAVPVQGSAAPVHSVADGSGRQNGAA